MSNFRPVFVDDRDQSVPAQRGYSKLFHRKSRTGCQRCRTRRVKCNEAKPVCRNCQRLNLPCVYDRQDPMAGRAKPDAAAEGTQTGPAPPQPEPGDTPGAGSIGGSIGDSIGASVASTDTDGDPDPGGSLCFSQSATEPPESRRRRMLELELMCFYVTETGPSLSFDKNGSSYDFCVRAAPRLAMKSDGLLYTIFAITALHRTKTTGGEISSIPSPPARETARRQYETYAQLAFEAHHRELVQISRDNADSLSATANMNRLITFAVLSQRSLEPYTPPIEWLRLTQNHEAIFRAAWDLVGDDPSSQIAKQLRATSVVWNTDEREGPGLREDFQHILHPHVGPDGHIEDDPAEWDPAVRRAYELTLSYVGGTWQQMKRNEPLGRVGRRLALFAVIIPYRFIELVAEARPRALVIMGHYFALWVVLKNFWHIHNTGPREVRALAAYLHSPWRELMEWPLRAVEEGLPYAPPQDS